MAEAKIEIGSREIWKIGDKGSEILTGYHAYILLTVSDGTEYILRGGPKNQKMLTDDLAIVGAESLLEYTENNRDIHHDWDDPDDGSPHYRKELISGTDEEMLSHFKDMQTEGKRITDEEYDYEILDQNSNAAVKSMVEAAGFEMPTIFDSKGNPVKLVGVDDPIKHGPVDKLYDVLEELGRDAYDGVGRTHRLDEREVPRWIQKTYFFR